MKAPPTGNVDEHFLEASNARDRYDREWTILQRVTLLRALLVLVILAMIYGYFFRVLQTNRDLHEFGTRSDFEQTATVAWFFTTHLKEENYTLTLDDDARLLVRVIEDIGRIHRDPVTVESRFPYQLQTLIEEARSRPDHIRLALPYLGEITLPLGYAALAFLTAILSFALNLYLLFRQIELRAILLYVSEHLMVVGSPHADEVGFAADFGAGQSIWRTTSREWDGGRRLFDLATGLSWKRLVQRRFSLLEIASAIITLAASLVLLTMAWYLSLEVWLRQLDELSALMAGGFLAVATAILLSLALRLVAKQVFASTEAA